MEVVWTQHSSWGPGWTGFATNGFLVADVVRHNRTGATKPGQRIGVLWSAYRRRPYRHLGEFDTADQAKAAVETELAGEPPPRALRERRPVAWLWDTPRP